MFKMLLIVVMVLASCVACTDEREGGDVMLTRLKDVPAAKLEALTDKSFFFGHQSVGYNILDGLAMLMSENPQLKLKIVESSDMSQIQPGVLLHSVVGENVYPQSKIDAFSKIMVEESGAAFDVAFLKFCYVDMLHEKEFQNPEELFDSYKKSVATWKEKNPNTVFVHFTLPLHAVPVGKKVTIKNLIGWEVSEQMDNVKRAHYNELMRKEYSGKEPLFDIARFESISPSTGKISRFRYDGQEYEAMAPENTDDGGHLSDSGKRWIAEQLVVLLASLPGADG